MIARWLLFSAALASQLAAATDAPVGLQRDVSFALYTSLAGNAERMRRLLSPLNAWRLQKQMQQAGQKIGDRAIDLAGEHFALYVPPQSPPQGYALLVFVPPWKDARAPQQWIPVLDKRGIIYVSAAHSGNESDVLDRREPLAVLAAYNAMRLYRVDPSRVYVGGFSGGSRVALRLALAYPDLFRGALLEAGSDPIGSAEITLPPIGLMHRFQQDSRVVFLTGEDDALHLAQDARSRASLKTWCMNDYVEEVIPYAGHEIAGGAEFNHAWTALEKRSAPEPDRLAACRADNQAEMAAQLQQARSWIARDKPDDARTLLERIDAQYGNLAAPRSTDLLRQLDARH